MGAPSRSVVLAALAAAAAAAGLAMLFFGGSAPELAESHEAGSKRARGSGEDAPSGIASAPPADAAPGSAAEDAAAPAAAGPSVEVRVLQGGVQPIVGCPVMGAERDKDGEWLACFDEAGPESGKTDGDGRFALRWPSEPPERLLVVFLDPGAEVERYEGAEAVGTLRDRHPILRAGAGPVVVHLRSPEGVLAFRLLDDRTGDPVGEKSKPFLQYEQPDGPDSWAVERDAMLAQGGGWWKPQPVSESLRTLRLRAVGYRDTPLEPRDVAGHRTFRLVPSESGIRGTLDVQVKGITHFEAALRRVDGQPEGPSQDVLGEIEGPGPFLLDGLSPGEWEIEIAVSTGGTSAPVRSYAIRSFAYRDGILDLGSLRPEPGASLRVRWSPLARDVPEKARLSLVRIGAEAVSIFGVAAEDGWSRFEGLRPGGDYAIRSDAVPGFREAVRAPPEPSGSAEFEAGRNLRLTRCRLSFTENGRKPEGLIFVQLVGGRGPEKEFDAAECVLTKTLVPGRHQFVTSLIEKGTLEDGSAIQSIRYMTAEVEVPDAPTFETTVELSLRLVVEGR